MDARRLLVVVQVIGALLIATGIGGAVLGGYAAVQADAGWCGHPQLLVLDSQEADEMLGSNGSHGPTFPEIDYESLSPAEQHAVEEALAGPDDVGEVTGSFPHAKGFERGIVVRHNGERYYAAVASYDECVDVPPGTFPVGLVVVGLGMGAFFVPTFASGRTGHDRGLVRPSLRSIRLGGPFSDAVCAGAFFGGVLLALLHPVGIVVAGAAVGLLASSWERAVVLGAYVGALVALVAVPFVWLDLGWTPPTLLGSSGPLALLGEAVLATVTSVAIRVLT